VPIAVGFHAEAKPSRDLYRANLVVGNWAWGYPCTQELKHSGSSEHREPFGRVNPAKQIPGNQWKLEIAGAPPVLVLLSIERQEGFVTFLLQLTGHLFFVTERHTQGKLLPVLWWECSRCEVSLDRRVRELHTDSRRPSLRRAVTEARRLPHFFRASMHPPMLRDDGDLWITVKGVGLKSLVFKRKLGGQNVHADSFARTSLKRFFPVGV